MTLALRSVMTEAEYDDARARLAPDKAAAGVRWEQDLALLFARSGWTQEKIAKKEGKGQQWISRRLIFGRFLTFTPTGVNAENLFANLTERRFRELWSETDQNEGNERIRFQQVMKLIEERISIVKPRVKPFGHEIKQKFGDGKWHGLDEIVAELGHDERDVAATLKGMQGNQNYKVQVETMLRGREQRPHFKIYPLEKSVGSIELAEKLGPLIKELKLEGKKNMATMVPANVAYFAEKLQRLLDEWTA